MVKFALLVSQEPDSW